MPNSKTEQTPGAREALIEAAIEAFGRDGFDAVGTRRIAGMAGVNPALISYYFSGKEGLYAACIKFIADQIGARMGPIVTALQEELEGAADPAAHRHALCRLTDGLFEVMTHPRSAPWARMILREQQDPSAEFQTIYEGPIRGILGLATRLCAGARGRSEVDADDRLTAMTVIGQVSFFRAHHAVVLRAMGWEAIGPAEAAAARRIIHANIHRMLGPGGGPDAIPGVADAHSP